MDESPSLMARLAGSPYQGYAYAYPHKTAYGRLPEPVALREAWAGESTNALFLYVHVPFCEMRCAFCNLFTHAHSRAGLQADLERAFLSALQAEARAVRSALGSSTMSVARAAVGGGTPTFFSVDALSKLFDIVDEMRGQTRARIPKSVEASPFTATQQRMQILRDRGVTRLSLGVQSFSEVEAAAAGRAQNAEEVARALDTIRRVGFERLNIDLIYGLPGQNVASWLTSVERALEWRPEELYLYPLYVRPLTGLERRNSIGVQAYGTEQVPPADEWDRLRFDCYRAARDLLLERGYRMNSMRHFQLASDSSDDMSDAYCCQDDGMVGIGCGSRSYTKALHYSSEFAVGRAGVKEIVDSYIAADHGEFDFAHYGFYLNDGEQRRRYLIKSLLRREGLDLDGYRARFGTEAFDDTPELAELLGLELARLDARQLVPTVRGLDFSDVIGPWLASSSVRERMRRFELR